MGHHSRHFIDCIKSRQRPIADVEDCHQISVACHLGNLSLKLGRALKWDAVTEEVIGDRKANTHLARPYREPWAGVLEPKTATRRRYEASSSQYLGPRFDFGNNTALLEDPMELVETLAPFVVNTHIKDMGVEEFPDGFLDLKRMVAGLGRHKPDARFSPSSRAQITRAARVCHLARQGAAASD